MSDDETRDEMEEIVNDEPVQEPAQEAVIETVVEEEVKPVKAKPKAKAKAKPKIKITKEPVEPIKEEEVTEEEPEPVIEEEPPTKKNKNKQMAKCTDCNLSMTQHTLKYIHKKGITAKRHFKKKLNNKLNKKWKIKRATWITEAEANKNNNSYYG